ncbi:hypothetical protein ALP05_00675 [Pseudomonas caricapapayae]|uniref:Uncharacterized protein n=1 Tax=Pseudomonas caricapapayae TaxID=46678 RepID=A0A3M6F7R6_9PSED|nr:hypothetical protein [Pseudomonas caricapapayae]RMV76438.1 hypothetical protein ALP05_00675 [Pseudomonas caricapapayae]
MKETIKYIEQLPDLDEAITEIATQYGYRKVGDKFNDLEGECVILLDELTVYMHSDVPLTVVKDIGLAVRKEKNKLVCLLHGGSFVTHKQIKMIIEIEKSEAYQAAKVVMERTKKAGEDGQKSFERYAESGEFDY